LNRYTEYNKDKPSSQMTFYSILIFILTIMFSCLQLGIYRKISNYVQFHTPFYFDYEIHDIFVELFVFSWRYQAILILLLIYNLVRFLYDSERDKRSPVKDENKSISRPTPDHSYNENDIKSIFFRYINLKNIELGFFNFFSIFLLFATSKYLPLGLCVLIPNYSSILSFLQTPSQIVIGALNKNLKVMINMIKFLSPVLTMLSAISLFAFFYYNQIHFEYSQETTENFLHMSVACLLCIISLLINYFKCQPASNELLSTYTYSQSILMIYLNTFLISLAAILCYLLVTFNFFGLKYILGWLFCYHTIIWVIVGMGFVTCFYLYLIYSSGINLESEWIKSMKLMEIPIIDTIGVYCLGLYSNPFNVSYFTGVMQIIIVFFLTDFWQIVFKKTKIN
jgi:hypothetical protein